MPFSILRLSNGNLSLEFETSDLPCVREVVEANYGKPKITVFAICSTVDFAGCQFTYQIEWDDPCLISNSDKGNQVFDTAFQLAAG